jgi:uncharacterized protein (TIGR04222 family)
MSADTWGIPGTTFLGLSAGVAAVALIVTLVVRRSLAAGPLRQGWQPTGEELAYFAGGPGRAVLAALAGLGAEKAVASQSGALAAIGRPPTAPSALTWAVYQEAQAGSPARRLSASPKVRAALGDIQSRLVDNGWLLDPGRRLLLRLAALPMFAVVALGVARYLAGSANGKPVTFIAIMTAVAVFVALLLLAVPSRNRAADAEVAGLRTRNSYLDPRSRPSMAFYGATGAAMAVGLYGAAALWVGDPAMAAEADIVRHHVAGGSYSGWYSGGDGGASGGGCGGGGGGCGGGGGGCGG